MKKTVSLLLATILLLSAVCSAGALFTDDAAISSKYTAAVTAMNEKGIIAGYSDGSFKPAGTLTRAQAAKIICCMLVGADKVDALSASSSAFTDVSTSHWAAKFVTYCAEKQIVSGVGNGKFNPDGKLTGSAFGKMLLVAFGADASSLTGSGWDANVKKQLTDKKWDSGVTVANTQLSREEACQLAYNCTLSQGAYIDGLVAIGDMKYKALGRTVAATEGLTCDYAASGMEFSVDCTGDMYLNYQYTTPLDCYLQVYVDGAEGLRPRITATTTKVKRVRIAKDLAEGKHTIRIVRDSDIDTAGNHLTFVGIEMKADHTTFAATEDQKLYIEYIGDSITSGKGALAIGREYEADDPCHSATHSYAYVSAGLLDADYSLVSRGGIGLFKCTPTLTILDIYDCVNGFASTEQKFDFGRKADVVVIAVGTNDSTDPATGSKLTDSQFNDRLKKLALKAREANGESCKVIFQYNMMWNNWASNFPAVAADLGGAAKGYYSLKVTRGNSGGRSGNSSLGHPSAEEQAVIAEELTAFIKSIL